jgi:hypothetical protein
MPQFPYIAFRAQQIDENEDENAAAPRPNRQPFSSIFSSISSIFI